MSKVLVLDDELTIRVLLADLLEDEGHEVRTGESGEVGLQVMAEWEPDVIMLDLRMPGLSGEQFCNRLPDEHRNVPVVIVSGSRDAHEVAARIGASHTIMKPFDLDEVIRVVAEAAGGR